MVISILFLPLLFFIGLITSWEDFHYGKVRNKWIILGLIYGVAVLIGLFFWNFIAEPVSHFYYANIKHLATDDPWPIFTVQASYFGQVILNSFLALLLGFLLWKYGLLAAGDAKLFFIFSLLLPLKYYWKSYLFYFPSFALFINIFLPVLFYIFLKAVWHILKTLKQLIKKKAFIKRYKMLSFSLVMEKSGQLAKILLSFIGVFLLVNRLRNFVAPWITPYLPSEGFLLLVLILVYRRFISLLRKSKKLFIFIVLFLVIYLSYGMAYNQQETIKELLMVSKMMVVFLLGFSLLRILFDYYIKNSALRKIKLDELRPGMSLVMYDDKKKSKIKKPKLGTIFGGGLSQKQVRSVKKWARENKIEQVEIYQRFPFASWMFLGVIITIILKGSLIMLIPFLK